MPNFIHLHLHSQYSLLDGAIKFPQLFMRVKELGMNTVALTDHGNIFGAAEFYKEAKKAGVKPIIGCEVYVAPTSRHDRSSRENYHLVLLSMNETGYRNLSKIVTKSWLEGFYGKPRVDYELLQDFNEGLMVLSACLRSEVCTQITKGNLGGALRTAARYKEMFGDRFYLEVQANRLPMQETANHKIKDIGKQLGIPTLATNDCHYLERGDAKSHDVLLCVQMGKTLRDETRLKFKGDEYFLKSYEEMIESLGREYEEEVERTCEVAERCKFEFKTNGYHLPEFEIEVGKSLDDHMTQLAEAGLERRLREAGIAGDKAKPYYGRLNSEIEIIKKMGFSGYFLVVADFINYAKSQEIPVGPGRGSAAGSLVAYALGITELDPIAYNLLFERFLNPERVSMPDIDIDFCAERRDEVIRYVTDKYGVDKVAQIGTFGTMSAKAVIKDVGRVLGIPYAEVDKVTKLIPSFRGKVYSIDESVAQIPQLKELLEESADLRELVDTARPLENMVRHSSTHAAGIVISNEPLLDYVPLYKGSKDEIVTQYDMKSVEDLGFVKFDFLGLKTLTIIDKATEFINKGKKSVDGLGVDIQKIPLDDPKVYQLLSDGRTRGIFQIESSGMRELLMRLQPSSFDDIIAALALYRPGPLDSGMVDEFIKRKHGQKKIDYPLSELQVVLEETRGLWVYQEQIMKTANVLADYSLAEADLLRRAMGKKDTNAMKAQRKRFLAGAKKRGIKTKKAEEIFDAMEKFAEYSFNKSHSAAYALITYQTAYLKAHYPAEFMAALLSVEANNTDRVIANIAECKALGIEVLPPDVNESIAGFTPIGGKIRFGLSAIKNVGEGTVEAIIESRGKGKFKSIFDFCERVDWRKLNRRTFESLVKSGAFDSLEVSRARLIGSIDSLLSYISSKQKHSAGEQKALFALNEMLPYPNLPEAEEWNEKDKLDHEREVLGFYVSGHPIAKYSEEIKRYTNTDTEGLLGFRESRDISLAGVVRSFKKKPTKNNSGLLGTLMLEDMKGSVEIVVFNYLLQRSLPLLEEGIEPIVVRGILEVAEDRVRIRASNIVSLRKVRDGATLRFYLTKGNASREKLLKLRQILEANPGNSQVYLHIKVSSLGEAVINVKDLRVSLNDELIEAAERFFGKGVLRVD